MDRAAWSQCHRLGGAIVILTDPAVTAEGVVRRTPHAAIITRLFRRPDDGHCHTEQRGYL